MSAYPYVQKERRSGIERRQSRVPVGITFEFLDRRKKTPPITVVLKDEAVWIEGD